MGHTFFSILSVFMLNTLYCGWTQDAKLSFTTTSPNFSPLFAGENVVFICDMSGGNDADWLYGFNWKGRQIVPFSNKNSFSLNLTAEQSGDYQCIGHRNGTTYFAQSNNVTLHVSAHRPKAFVRADRTTIPLGGSVTLTCFVQNSSGWTYDWFRRTPVSNEIMIQTSSVENSVTISDEGMYRCRGRRGNPAFFTNYSEVHRTQKTLSDTASVTLRHFTEIFSGEMITLKCEIQGGGDAAWEYEWRTTSSKILSTHSEYNMSSASVSYSGDYWCKGRRDLYFSTAWSNAFTLRVSPNKPKVKIAANTRTIPVEGTATLSCHVENSADWKYYWFRRTSVLSEFQLIGDGKIDNFISVSQGGIYHCKGGRGNPVFFTEDSDLITVEKRVSSKASVFQQPSWPLIFIDEMISVRCQISDNVNTDWEYEWSKPTSDAILTKNEYRTIDTSLSSIENYKCMGKNKLDLYSVTEWSDSITLTVYAQRPKAIISADNRAFLEGDRVTLTCSVTPSSTGWSYYWYRGKKTSEPLTMSEFVFHSESQVSVTQEGNYWCKGGRGNPVYYTEYSNPVGIHRIVTNTPVVTLQHTWPKIYRGETIILKCEIPGGDTEWDYEWATNTSDDSPNQNEYRIDSVSESHRGDYWCKGRMKSAQQNSTRWSAPFKLTFHDTFPTDKPYPVLTASPSWLSPGASVILNCKVEHPSAGWKFYWYKAVPRIGYFNLPQRRHLFDSHHFYKFEISPGIISGTETDSYIVHGQTHTAGYVCRAGRGNPVYYTDYSELVFVWSGDFNSAASLTVSPDRVQHFISDSVSLNCDGNSSQWRVMRLSGYRFNHSDCSSWGTMNGSTCNIDIKQYNDSVYWCESESGEFSNAVNITVHDGDVILVSPVHPVTEGGSVALGCKSKTGNVSTIAFYKNGKIIQNDDRQELNISTIKKSDEGFYKCEYAGYESPESWMPVKASRSSHPVPLITGLVIGILLILLLPLLLFCWYRKSNGTFWIRQTQCQETNQTSATVHATNCSENQQQIYSSLLHGDSSVYESMRTCENTGRWAGDYGTKPQIQLKRVEKRRKHSELEESSVYDNMNPN